MSWKNEVFKNFKLYAITDLGTESPEELKKIESAYQGGADIVQLRSKVLTDAAMLRIGRAMRSLADRYQKLFFVNDRVDLALAADADGVHVGQEDLPVAEIRKICDHQKKSLWIGKSTHTVEQALQGVREGADYIGVGPIFGTPTKPDYPPTGLELMERVRDKIRIPWVAIGGINEENLETVLKIGAERVAVVRAIFAAEDIENATRKLRDQIERANQHVVKN